MKVTFELPPLVVERLRFHVPRGQRSRFVTDLIVRKLRNRGNVLERAAQKANKIRRVNKDMKSWEALNAHKN
jgi:hypothetical protein